MVKVVCWKYSLDSLDEEGMVYEMIDFFYGPIESKFHTLGYQVSSLFFRHGLIIRFSLL
jgi:hypothetical protein